MKRFLIAFTIFLIWSVLGLWLYSWLNPGVFSGKSESPVTARTMTIDSLLEPKNTSYPDNKAKESRILVEDTLVHSEKKMEEIDFEENGLNAFTKSGDIIFSLREGIIITKNSNEIIIPESTLGYKNKLSTYLKDHPDTEIHISSLYSAQERNESPNLGFQRGTKIKESLVAAGIPSEKIVIKSYIKPFDFSKNNTFSQSFTFYVLPLDLERIQKQKSKNLDVKIVYPTFTTSGILSNQNLKVFLEDVKKIVAENPSIIIELIGHTDNVGNASDNYSMGLQYAKQVKWYLINKGGIGKNNVITSSKGESEPIDTNKTERGRMVNRRIEVKFYLNQ